MYQEVLFVLPHAIQKCISPCMDTASEEIRLRIGQAPHIVSNGDERPVSSSIRVNTEDLQYVLSAASSASLYAVNDKLREGFITLPKGHRLGICGEAVTEHDAVKTIRNISSINIRIAHERQGIGFQPRNHTLIIGPPGSGKTTLLRDCIRRLSDSSRERVCILDERGEIAACRNGVPQFDIGQRTDVLCGCKKQTGMLMLLRSMSPQWLAMDEITKSEDVEAVIHASYCGVKLLATAHADSLSDFRRRPIYRQLAEANIFENLVFLTRDHKQHKGGAP